MLLGRTSVTKLRPLEPERESLPVQFMKQCEKQEQEEKAAKSWRMLVQPGRAARKTEPVDKKLVIKH